jgi:hypothetical protein
MISRKGAKKTLRNTIRLCGFANFAALREINLIKDNQCQEL